MVDEAVLSGNVVKLELEKPVHSCLSCLFTDSSDAFRLRLEFKTERGASSFFNLVVRGEDPHYAALPPIRPLCGKEYLTHLPPSHAPPF